MKKGITRREYAVTDAQEIIGILDRGKIVHVGMVDEGKPYVVPMNYGYEFENRELVLYLHGATAGRKLDILRAQPHVFIEIDTDIVAFDGKLACQYGVSYSSIMGEGVAQIVENMDEKKHGLTVLMKTQVGKDFVFTDKMANVVAVIKIRVADFTAKRRPLRDEG